jgi:hypothetical protein
MEENKVNFLYPPNLGIVVKELTKILRKDDRWFFAKSYKMQKYFQNDEPENGDCLNSL